MHGGRNHTVPYRRSLIHPTAKGRPHTAHRWPDIYGHGGVVDNNRLLTVALIVLGAVASVGILTAIVAAIIQGRDPASIAIATVPVLLAAVAALVKQDRDQDRKGPDAQ